MDKHEIMNEINQTVKEIDAVLASMRKTFSDLPEGVSYLDIRDTNGNWLAGPLLIAKAQLLGIVLQNSDSL